jgi:gliding motility-associated-like protein
LKSIQALVLPFISIFFVLITLDTNAQTPGGISTGLQLWLKANAGVTTTGVNVTGWQDQSVALTPVTVNGSPDLTNPGYNYNPYINFTLSSATGGDFLGIPTNNFQSFFWVAQLENLTRPSTHLATFNGVTLGQPCNGCPIHGGENGGVIPQYHELGYGNGTFQAAGVWRKNGTATGIAYNTPHSGNYDIITALGGSAVVTNVLMGGQNSNLPAFDGRLRDWLGPVGEIIAYTGAVPAAQANIIESYLAVKYGITLGGNGSTTLFYTAPNNTTIWDANTGYHYDVAGIGNDNIIEGLDQPKSHSINTPNDAVIMAHNNFAAPVSLIDGQYLLWGNNNGSYNFTCGSFTHADPSTTLNASWGRTWRTQKTGTPTGNVIIAIDMSLFQGPTGLGSTNNAEVRLLVDDNTAFGDASTGEHTYTPDAGFGASGGQLFFTVPYTDIQDGIGYFSLGFLGTPPVVSIAAADTTLCLGNTLILDAGNVGSTYLWSTTETTQTITITATGTYYVTVTSVCASQSDSIIITQPIPPALIGNDTVYCSNFTRVLDAGLSTGGYLWSDGSTNQTLSINQAGLYWVELDNGCGVFKDSIQIIESSPPQVNLGGDTIYCGQSFSRTFDASCASCTYLWFNNTVAPQLTITTPGLITVTVTNVCGTASDNAFIELQPFLFVTLPNDTIICSTTGYAITANTNATDLLWSNGNVNPSIIIPDAGIFWVDVSNQCSIASDTIKIIKCLGEFIMPSAFSPNADGFNDVLFPVQVGDASLIQFEVYNRWGQNVFGYNGGYKNKWDGTFKKQPCSIGVYSYVVTYKDNISGALKSLKGNVTLLR